MIIDIKNVNYIYNPGTPFEKKALSNINIQIDEGEFIGLIGHTGSGKSTLVQHLNGLLKPTSGDVIVDGINTSKKDVSLREIRQKVGLVFQYPEHQLFEETIYADIAFGPKNLGLKDNEVDMRVKSAMENVGLDFESLKDRSPFELSGGQKRRAAIAGVIAMKPKLLILDEPTAGLDPAGRDEILGGIRKLYEKEKMTIVLVSHSMEDIAKLANRILVMDKGELVMDDSPKEVFKRAPELEEIGLGVPQITNFMRELKSKGYDVNDEIITVEEAKEEILKYLRSREDV
ncbi:MAG: energy-coupling factor transporter ATPase [Tissierellia bacterium]|nr:energy-coupling factor transporter ATPase [Tissierellia bacterium]MDD4726471.1 energy-coupling factor transporter ATPase [Tissierellia bacterium]